MIDGNLFLEMLPIVVPLYGALGIVYYKLGKVEGKIDMLCRKNGINPSKAVTS